MSCITEILKLKGDKEFLPVKRDGYSSEIIIEGGGYYKGYEYLITFTDNGFRCGYVAITSEHPTYIYKGDYPHFDVHGGITFFEESHLAEVLLGHTCTDKWLGFDAGHWGDIYDMECSLKYFPNLSQIKREHIQEMNKIMGMNRDFPASFRTREYMEQECKDLIEQLIKVEAA